MRDTQCFNLDRNDSFYVEAGTCLPVSYCDVIFQNSLFGFSFFGRVTAGDHEMKERRLFANFHGENAIIRCGYFPSGDTDQLPDADRNVTHIYHDYSNSKFPRKEHAQQQQKNAPERERSARESIYNLHEMHWLTHSLTHSTRSSIQKSQCPCPK